MNADKSDFTKIEVLNAKATPKIFLRGIVHVEMTSSQSIFWDLVYSTFGNRTLEKSPFAACEGASDLGLGLIFNYQITNLPNYEILNEYRTACITTIIKFSQPHA